MRIYIFGDRLGKLEQSRTGKINAVQASHLDRMFGGIFCWPSPRTRHGGVHRLRMLRARAKDATRQIAFAKRTPQNNPQHCDGRRPVLPCVEDSVRRPQRPGNHSRTEARSGGTLPIIHPRELPGTAGSAAMLWQGPQNISLQCQHCAPYADSLQAKIRRAL